MHDGEMRIESEIGKGSTFVFTLPKYTGQDLKKEVEEIIVA